MSRVRKRYEDADVLIVPAQSIDGRLTDRDRLLLDAIGLPRRRIVRSRRRPPVDRFPGSPEASAAPQKRRDLIIENLSLGGLVDAQDRHLHHRRAAFVDDFENFSLGHQRRGRGDGELPDLEILFAVQHFGRVEIGHEVREEVDRVGEVVQRRSEGRKDLEVGITFTVHCVSCIHPYRKNESRKQDSDVQDQWQLVVSGTDSNVVEHDIPIRVCELRNRRRSTDRSFDLLKNGLV